MEIETLFQASVKFQGENSLCRGKLLVNKVVESFSDHSLQDHQLLLTTEVNSNRTQSSQNAACASKEQVSAKAVKVLHRVPLSAVHSMTLRDSPTNPSIILHTHSSMVNRPSSNTAADTLFNVQLLLPSDSSLDEFTKCMNQLVILKPSSSDEDLYILYHDPGLVHSTEQLRVSEEIEDNPINPTLMKPIAPTAAKARAKRKVPVVSSFLGGFSKITEIARTQTAEMFPMADSLINQLRFSPRHSASSPPVSKPATVGFPASPSDQDLADFEVIDEEIEFIQPSGEGTAVASSSAKEDVDFSKYMIVASPSVLAAKAEEAANAPTAKAVAAASEIHMAKAKFSSSPSTPPTPHKPPHPQTQAHIQGKSTPTPSTVTADLQNLGLVADMSHFASMTEQLLQPVTLEEWKGFFSADGIPTVADEHMRTRILAGHGVGADARRPVWLWLLGVEEKGPYRPLPPATPSPPQDPLLNPPADTTPTGSSSPAPLEDLFVYNVPWEDVVSGLPFPVTAHTNPALPLVDDPLGLSRAKQRALNREWRCEQYYALVRQWASISPAQEKRSRFFTELKVRIDKDVVRTDRDVAFFAGENNANIPILYRLLLTYCFYNFDLGYVQGMNDLLSPLLYILRDEVDTFWAFVAIMDKFENHFFVDQSGITQEFSRLLLVLEHLVPRLHAYLTSRKCENLHFCYRWILVLFKREFGFEETIRLWEMMFSGACGSSFHLFIAAAILDLYKDTIIAMGMELDDILRFVNGLSNHMAHTRVLLRARQMYRHAQEHCAEELKPLL